MFWNNRTNSKCSHKQIYFRLNSGKLLLSLLQSILSSQPVFKNIIIKTQKYVILSVFYRHITMSLRENVN
jgi:hypothetical protein